MEALPTSHHEFGDAQAPFPDGPKAGTQRAWNHTAPPWEKTVAAEALPATIEAVMAQVREGFSFLVTDEGKVVARIDPEPLPPAGRFGVMAGQFEVPDDFDGLPDDLIDIIEGQAEDD